MYDGDLLTSDRDALLMEVLRLRGAIREHRDCKGHQRCWLNDLELYGLLPEAVAKKIDLSLPPKDEFLKNCALFHQCRQDPKTRRQRSGPIRAFGFFVARMTGINL